jgi:hypothetical protein
MNRLYQLQRLRAPQNHQDSRVTPGSSQA